jgi:GT2 family glycosyltransferase
LGTAPSDRGIVAVVVSYRSAVDLPQCIAALRRELTHPSDRIVVVDNASTDDSVLVAHAAGAAVVALPRNVGFGAGCNRGAAQAPGQDVLLVNPDAVAQPNSVAALRNALAADSRRGAVGPRIQRTDGGPEPGCRRSFPRPKVAFFRLARLDRLLPRRFGAYNRLDTDAATAGPIEAGSGAALLVRRRSWDEIGGFDESFFMYGEDLDLCYRLSLAGWRAWYEPAASFVHVKAASTRQVRARMLYHFHRAMWLYYRKHHSGGAAGLLAPLVLIGVSGRFAVLLVVGALRAAQQRTSALRRSIIAAGDHSSETSSRPSTDSVDQSSGVE